MSEHNAETDAPGYCPTCNALPDEMCTTPSGKPRDDHKARRVIPPAVTDGGDA